MPTPIRVGILGLTHDHIWGNLNDLNYIIDGKIGRGRRSERATVGENP